MPGKVISCWQAARFYSLSLLPLPITISYTMQLLNGWVGYITDYWVPEYRATRNEASTRRRIYALAHIGHHLIAAHVDSDRQAESLRRDARRAPQIAYIEHTHFPIACDMLDHCRFLCSDNYTRLSSPIEAGSRITEWSFMLVALEWKNVLPLHRHDAIVRRRRAYGQCNNRQVNASLDASLVYRRFSTRHDGVSSTSGRRILCIKKESITEE